MKRVPDADLRGVVSAGVKKYVNCKTDDGSRMTPKLVFTGNWNIIITYYKS